MPAVVRDYDPAAFSVSPDALYVFDYDGVIVAPLEHDIYYLPGRSDEEEILAVARKAFGIRCDGMELRYQRHLLYQAALSRNGKPSEPGPAFAAFRAVCEAGGQAFVLTARAGWHAAGRLRDFMRGHRLLPVEIFHIGRVSKSLQIARLLAEYPTRPLVYLEDLDEHIQNVTASLAQQPGLADRLHVLRVRPTGPCRSEAELRRLFADEIAAAIAR